jgi:hypothetical protein
MANTLTGGYDVCIELSPQLLTRFTAPVLLARDELRPAVLPVTIGAGARTLSGEATLFVTGAFVDVAPTATPRVTVRLRFEGSALAVTAPRADSAGDLSGTIEFGAPVRLAAPVPAGGGARTQEAVVDLAALGGLTLTLTDPSRRALEALMGRFGLRASDAVAGLEAAAEAAAQLVAAVLGELPVPFSVALAPDGHDGTLDPLTFVDVRLVTAAAAGPFPRRVLALLGTLVRDHAGRGDPEDKTELALGASDGAAMVLSPSAFRRLVLCPEVFRAILPAYLQRELPGGFLGSVPASAFTPFVEAVPDDERRDLRRDLREWIDENDVEAFFDRFLPRPLPLDALAGLGPELAAALPPGVRASLRDTPAAARRLLPPQCGRSEGLPIPEARVTQVGVAFRDGSMRLSGVVLPDKTGVTGWLEFWSDLTLTVGDDMSLEPTATDPAISSYLALEWWVHWLGAIALLTGFLHTFETVEADRARREAEETIDGAVRSLRAVSLTLPDGVTLSEVDIEPRGIVLHALADPVDLPEPELPRLNLSWTRTGPARSSQPPQTLEVHNDCLDGTFTYTEVRQQFHYVYTAITEHIRGRIRYEWFVANHRAEGGGLLETEDGEILAGWTASGNGLTLFSAFPDRPLTLPVVVRATGDDGTTAEASATAYFDGPLRIFDDPTYGERMRECISQWVDELSRGFGVERPPLLRDTLEEVLDRFANRQPGRFGVIDPVELATLLEAGELAGIKAPVWLEQTALRLPVRAAELRLRSRPRRRLTRP